MTALLTLDGVSKRFRGLVAVDQVGFAVPQGAIFAVIGPNGAGKTTLFNMIAGAMAPDAGSITFAGLAVQGLPADAICRRGIARTFQIVRPFPALSVEDNVIIGALLHRRNVDCARTRARALLAQLELFDKRHRIASTLTLPDRKRLEVARALATEPQLLLLDEVMAGLRPTETDRMVAILQSLNRDGVTILLIEHVMRAVMALASRVLVLDHGVAIAEGAPEIRRARSRRRAVLSWRRGGVMRPERTRQKWIPVLRPDTRHIRNLERDDDSKVSHPALVERAVDHIDDLAGRYIDQQQVGSVSYPLEARVRRRQSESGPVGIVIGRRQEQRRQRRADGPTPVSPTVRINERRNVDPIDRAAALGERPSRAGAGMRTGETRAWSNNRGPRSRLRAVGRSCSAGRSGRPCRGFGAAARRFPLLIVLGSRQSWRRERERRGNGEHASNDSQHADLSFAESKRRRICRRRAYQNVPGDVTLHDRAPALHPAAGAWRPARRSGPESPA